MGHTYPPALIKCAHVGEPGSGAEPGGHDHGGAVGGKHLETISIDTINREEQLSHNPSGYLPENHSESDKPCMALPCQYKGSSGFRGRVMVSGSPGGQTRGIPTPSSSGLCSNHSLIELHLHPNEKECLKGRATTERSCVSTTGGFVCLTGG